MKIRLVYCVLKKKAGFKGKCMGYKDWAFLVYVFCSMFYVFLASINI